MHRLAVKRTYESDQRRPHVNTCSTSRELTQDESDSGRVCSARVNGMHRIAHLEI